MANKFENDFLNRIQTKIMLECFGVALSDQPGTVKDCDSLLAAFKKRRPDEYEKYIKIIRDKDFDSLSETPPVVLNYSDLVSALDKDIFEKTLSQVSQTQEALNKVVALEGSLNSSMHTMLSQFRDTLDLETRKANQDLEEYTTNSINVLKGEFLAILKEEAKKFRQVKIQVGDKPSQKVKGLVHEKFEDILSLCANGINTLLVGPAGCGKTFLASQIADSLDLPFASQSCSEGISESNFVGWLLPTGESGRFEYVQSQFVDLYENGGVFLFDEMDASDPNVLVFLNQALANEKFYLPQRFLDPEVSKHKDFVAIGAANTFGTGADLLYHGRNSLDAATLDRFKVGTVQMDYCPSLESSIIDSEVLEWGQRTRERIEENRLQKILSTRVLSDATKMKGAGWDLLKIASQYFSDWSLEELRAIRWSPQEVLDYSGTTTIPPLNEENSFQRSR